MAPEPAVPVTTRMPTMVSMGMQQASQTGFLPRFVEEVPQSPWCSLSSVVGDWDRAGAPVGASLVTAGPMTNAERENMTVHAVARTPPLHFAVEWSTLGVSDPPEP